MLNGQFFSGQPIQFEGGLIKPPLFGNDTYTKILLHCDGSDASTTITDSNAGGSAHTWTARGNAQIDTAISKLGGGALLCDGTGDYVDTPDHADFTLGSGAWTADCWFNVAGGSGTDRRLFGQNNNTGSIASTSIVGRLQTTNTFICSASVGGVSNNVTTTTAISSAGWHHFAFVRTGNILRVFIDGVQEGGDVACTGTVNDSANTFSVGRGGELASQYWNGSIDEFRLSVGIARWTSNFTPPTVPYRN